MTTPGPRRALEKGLLVLVPIATLALWPSFFAAKGPYWLGQNADPDYPYLLNALAVAEGHSPSHTDHPGTTLHLLGAAFVRVFHLAAGEGALADDVVRRAEDYLLGLNWALLVAYAGLLALLALAVRRATGSTLAGLVAGATPLLSETVVYSVVSVKPEPLLAILAAGLALAAASAVEREERRASVRLGLVLGALAGAAIVTKVTAAPLVVLPLVLLSGRRARVAFAAATGASALLLLAPALPRLGSGLALLGRIATHRGVYGSGEESLFDGASYLAAVGDLLGADPVFAAAILLGAAALVADRLRASRGPAALRAALLATIAAQAACVLLVARHPKPHYLLPGLGLTGLALALAFALLARGVARPWLLRAPALVLLAAVAVFAGRELGELRRDFDAMRRQQLAAVQEVERLGAADVIHYYRSSSPAFALYFGNIYTSMRYERQATALHPNAYFYNIFFDIMDPRLEARTASSGAGRFALQGTPLDEAALSRIRLPGRWTRTYGNDLEAVYRLE